MDRTDENGTWHSDDDGVTWALVTPSPAWVAAHPPAETADPTADPLDVLAQVRDSVAAITHTSTMANVRDALIGVHAAIESALS